MHLDQRLNSHVILASYTCKNVHSLFYSMNVFKMKKQNFCVVCKMTSYNEVICQVVKLPQTKTVKSVFKYTYMNMLNVGLSYSVFAAVSGV